MTDAPPFDRDLPSPIGRLLQLRAGASEAVVRDGHSSPIQALMARSGVLEDRLWSELAGQPPLRLLVLTGSAGSGKSATLNHLLQRERDTGAGRIGAHLADATHSDSPDRDQAERLAEFLSPFSDGAAEPGEACRVIAMNTGMALRFFSDLADLPGKPSLSQLETLLRARLGLRELEGAVRPPEWMERAVMVVNLDHRGTSGVPGALFEDILQRLDPEDPSGVLEGAARCGTCQVRDWCWPMANARAISSEAGRRALNAAAGDLALTRGRQLAPRALWDAAAELALGGLDIHRLRGRDACYAVVDVADAGDEAVLVHAMACNGALGPVLLDEAPLVPAADGSLVAELAQRDPSYGATSAAHELMAYGGVDPAADAKKLLELLDAGGEPHPAVRRAARALEDGAAAAASGDRMWGRVLARAAWLGGQLPGNSAVASDFAAALGAQARLATEDDGTADSRALLAVLSIIEEGLAAVFGLISGPEHYYPTTNPGVGAGADLMVRVGLLEDAWLATRRDPHVVGNERGAEAIGYRPLALSLEVANRPVAVDHPLWVLLEKAAAGATPSTLELERFLALRQAIRLVGVRAAAEADRPLLVRERGAAGRRFRIVVRNRAAGVLRATEVR